MKLIESYVGMKGVAVDVESASEVWQALDTIHTQIMDNIGEDSPLLNILEEAMAKIMEHLPEDEQMGLV